MTVKITKLNTFINYFTKRGRMYNQLIKDLRENGCTEFYKRKLPNGSKMITAYKDNKSTSAYTFLFKKNGNYVQKQSEKSRALLPWKRTYIKNTKVYTSTETEAVTIVSKLNRYDNNVKTLSQYEKILPDGTKINRAQGEAIIPTSNINTNNVTESMSYIKPNGDYNIHLIRNGKPEFYIGNNANLNDFKFQFV